MPLRSPAPPRLLLPILVLASLAMTACSSVSDLSYAPSVAIVPGPPSVAAVSVRDIRDEKPNRFATVRGGYGNPAYVRDTSKPVSDEVAAIFTRALETRGMLAGAGPYRFQVILRTFYANKYISRAAYIDMDLVVTDRLGRTVYRDAIKDENDHFVLFDADIDALAKMAETLLNTAVDRLLDKPALRSVLSNPAAPPVS